MYDSSPEPFLAHIARSRTARLPGGRRRIFAGDRSFGWADPRIFEILKAERLMQNDVFVLPDGQALEPLGQRLAARGLFRTHNELFDVFDDSGIILGQVDRGALPLLGCKASGVHLNGLVDKPEGLHLWIGHRASNKRLDPGKLDHLAAGGVCTGMGPLDSLVKEAGEEAGIPPELTRNVQHVATLRYAMDRPEGLRRDTLYCYDLFLPETFVPTPVDGEVECFKLLPVETVFRIVRDTQQVKFNVNLVMIDLFLRIGMFGPGPASILREALDRP